MTIQLWKTIFLYQVKSLVLFLFFTQIFIKDITRPFNSLSILAKTLKYEFGDGICVKEMLIFPWVEKTSWLLEKIQKIRTGFVSLGCLKTFAYWQILDLVKFVMCALVSRDCVPFSKNIKRYVYPGNQGTHDKLK